MYLVDFILDVGKRSGSCNLKYTISYCHGQRDRNRCTQGYLPLSGSNFADNRRRFASNEKNIGGKREKDL